MGKQCPHCGAQNLQYAQTCIECKKVIDPIKLGIIIEEAERANAEREEMKAQVAESTERAQEAESLLKEFSDIKTAIEQTRHEMAERLPMAESNFGELAGHLGNGRM
jgi:hypothetical protein